MYIRFVVLLWLSCLMTTSVYANNQAMEAQELLYDWDSLVGKTVTFNAMIESADSSEKVLTFGGNLTYQVLAGSLDREEFIWVAENCEPNYYCWMTVTGSPKASSEFDVFKNFEASDISIEVFFASAIADNGWVYYDFMSEQAAVNSAKNDLAIEAPSAGCCVTFEHWVPLESILDGSYGISFAFFEGEGGSFNVHYEDALHTKDNDIFVMEACKEALEELGTLRRSITDCHLVENFSPF